MNRVPIAELEVAATDPSQFPTPRTTTGTVDDADAPGDEHEGENEAGARETRDDMEAPEEFDLGGPDQTASAVDHPAPRRTTRGGNS